MISLSKPFKWCITLPLLAWSIFRSMAAGGQISTHAQIWSMRPKKCQTHFLHFWTSELQKQSKYRFRQLMHTELQYWIFAPALEEEFQNKEPSGLQLFACFRTRRPKFWKVFRKTSVMKSFVVKNGWVTDTFLRFSGNAEHLFLKFLKK